MTRIGLTRAVLFSVSSQAWMALAGPVTVIAIAHALDPVAQGFYYTFSSVLGIQIFFELGLGTVMVQMASHEWASLSRESGGRIYGSELALSRLASIARLSMRWYGIAAFLLTVVLIIGGNWFFSGKADEHAISWLLPWSILSVTAGLSLLITPILSIVEGCNQITSVYRIRLLQSIGSSVVIIAGLFCGWGLVSLAIGSVVRLCLTVICVVFEQRDFVRIFRKNPCAGRVNWRKEVWPFQWRIAISWLSGYFVFSLFVPVMFQFHGPIVAGQMGMTLSLVGAVESVACAWIITRVPEFGALIARRNFSTLDQLFVGSIKRSLATALLGSMIVVTTVVLLRMYLPVYADRLLPLLALILFVLYRIANVGISGLALYLRSHKQEPLVWVSVVSAVIIGLLTYFVGRDYGPLGVSVGLLLTTVLWTLPACLVVFFRCRRDWHISA